LSKISYPLRQTEDPLLGPRLKIARAKAEIERLGLAEESFKRDTRYKVVRAEFDAQAQEDVLRVRVDGLPPSPEWGVYIGEIAHNLRSALDGLVYRLALKNTDTPAGNTQFPIFEFRRTTKKMHGRPKELIHHFEGMRRGDGRSMIRNLLPKHQALIERLQPYHRKNSTHFKPRNRIPYRYNSPLWWLHEINNADKHRLIQVVGTKIAAGPGFFWTGDDRPHIGSALPRILKDGAKIGTAPRNVHVDSYIIPTIAFADGCEVVRMRSVCIVLEKILTCVSEIVESFASEFNH
jgi:hypothetical protein